MLTYEKITDAAKLLNGVVSRTALVSADALDPRAEQIYIKAENLQKTGAFKLRGAYYKISRLTKAELDCGVIAASAGNHAQGVAFAAKEAGAACVICMPEGAPLSKIEQTKSYGAVVELCPGVFDDCLERAKQLQAEKGYTFIHPFDDEDVIAGQGTVGLEIMQDIPDTDVVFAPVGGGGLIGGLALAIKNINPSARIVGVEASGAASMFLSRKRQSVVGIENVSTIADGIAVKRPSELTFELCSRYVDKIVTVSDAEIASAMLLLMERYKMIAEGAGAVAVAAAMYSKQDLSGKKAVCVLSGGNVDVNVLSSIINKGLKNTGRITQFSTELIDRPRQLSTFLQIVSGQGANILNISHDRNRTDVDIGRCFVDITVETRNHDHARELLDAIKTHGYFCMTE